MTTPCTGWLKMMHDQRARQLKLNKMHKRLRSDTGRAIKDYNMIEEGDRIMVCISGGKDSLTMLDILMNLQRHSPVGFSLTAVNLDQRQPGFPADVLPAWFEQVGVDYEIISEDTYSLVKQMVPEGKTYCGWCSRFRRGILYRVARDRGFDKIALGHHRDDIIETLFLNLFYGGKLKAMPPKLRSDNGAHIVIRPLAYCAEKDIARYAQLMEFPVIPCDLCGSQDHLQRQAIKSMLQTWDRDHPGRIQTIMRGITDVVPSHLADHRLFDFRSLVADAAAPECIEVVNL